SDESDDPGASSCIDPGIETTDRQAEPLLASSPWNGEASEFMAFSLSACEPGSTVPQPLRDGRRASGSNIQRAARFRSSVRPCNEPAAVPSPSSLWSLAVE